MRQRGTWKAEETGHPAGKPGRGSLLVALPSLLDANFRRTILFLSHHDTGEGALGFILNRPRKESFGELATAPVGMEQVPVFDGGPVERQSLILTRLLWDQKGARFQSLGEEDLEDKNESSGLRAFTGYAGWSAGQLEKEIAQKSWVVLPATSALLEPVLTVEEGLKRWKAIMKGLGPMYYLLAQAPDDPGLN